MDKISYKDFQIIMHRKIEEDNPSEIDFYIDDCKIYELCYMGKMVDKETNGYAYWFGLVKGGSQAYDYPTFEEFANAKVFYGKQSLKEIWDRVSITSLNGGTCEEMLAHYLGEANPALQAV